MEGLSEECPRGQNRRKRREGPRVGKDSGAVFHELLSKLTLELSREERMKGIIHALFEGVLSEPDFSVAYANVCHRLKGLKVPTSENPDVTVTFNKLLLNCCQYEFEIYQDAILEEMKQEMDAATEDEERQRLTEELHHRSLGNIKLICEMFKLKMLREGVMHDCIIKLLKKNDEKSLECACTFLSTAGKNLDFEKAKPLMDQYFSQMDKIIKEGETSSRISFMLQEILDLRQNNWVPMSSDQGPTTIDQDHKEAELEKKIKVQVKLLSKTDSTLGHEVCRPQFSTVSVNQPQVPISPEGSGAKPSVEQDHSQLINQMQDWQRRGPGPEDGEDSESVVPELLSQLTMEMSREERLQGVAEALFEGVLSEPNFSAAYALLCDRIKWLKVPTASNPGYTVNFRKLLLKCCRTEFEKAKNGEMFEQINKELYAATEAEECKRLTDKLAEEKDKAHRRSLGNIRFTGELFNLKMLSEGIMHDCIRKLLKTRDEESLECLCTVLSTVGKNLDNEKSKPHMDQYLHQTGKIIKERYPSSRIRFMLQDLLDLRQNNWVPMSGDQSPKMIDQIHKLAKLEEQIKLQVQLLSNKDKHLGHEVHRKQSSSGKMSQPQDRGLSKAAISFGGSGATSSVEQDSGESSISIMNPFIAAQMQTSSSTSSSSSVEPANVAASVDTEHKASLQAVSSASITSVPLLQSNIAGAGASLSPPPASANSSDLLKTA